MNFKKILIICFIFAKMSFSIDFEQSRKLLTDLTKNNLNVLSQFDTFNLNLINAFKDNKIFEPGLNKIIQALNFAAEKHQNQTRKDQAQTPYIIHPIGVANNVLSIGKVYDVETIIGALLHDTIEDTNTSSEEIKHLFGDVVLQYVLEVTDDKTLKKEERKKLQIEHAHKKSCAATIIKLADFSYNLNDLLYNPPTWPKERINEYFEWANKVINNLPKTNVLLENHLIELINIYNIEKLNY